MLNEWSHNEAEMKSQQSIFYEDGNPTFKVSDLKHGDSKGKIGLFVGIGANGYLKKLKANCID